MTIFKHYSKEERGNAAIEFSLIFPVFFLLIMGIIELGFILWGYSSLEYGASYGARYAFTHPTSSAQTIQDAALSRIENAGSSFSYTATIAQNSYVDVDGTFSYTFFFLPINPIVIKAHVHQVLPLP